MSDGKTMLELRSLYISPRDEVLVGVRVVPESESQHMTCWFSGRGWKDGCYAATESELLRRAKSENRHGGRIDISTRMDHGPRRMTEVPCLTNGTAPL